MNPSDHSKPASAPETHRVRCSIALVLCLFVAGCTGGMAVVPDRDSSTPGDVVSERAADTGGIDPADVEDPEPCPDEGPCGEAPEELDDGGAMDDGGAVDDSGTEIDGGADLDGGPGIADARTDAPRLVDAIRADAPDVRTVDAGPVTLPTPTCTNVDARLRNDFGIIITPGTLPWGGLAPQNIGCADRIKVYQMFVRPFGYDRYARLMGTRAVPFTMHLYGNSAAGCSGYVPNTRAMQIRNLRQCLAYVSSPTDSDFNRIAMFLIHESGHILRQRNLSLGTNFQGANLTTRDASCYDRGFIITYSLRSTTWYSESISEAMGLFIVNRKVGTLGTITDFRTQCNDTYAWVRANVFNDT